MDNENGEQPWHSSQGYFTAQMDRRIAEEIGRGVIQRHTSEVRAEMAEGQAREYGGALAAIEGEVEKLKAQLAELQGGPPAPPEPVRGLRANRKGARP